MQEQFKNIFNQAAVIIDPGSSQVKAGFSGDEHPVLVFDSFIGHAKYSKLLGGGENEVVGPQPHLRGLYKLTRPIERGVFQTDGDLKLVLAKIFSEMNITDSKQMPVFVTETPFTPTNKKTSIARVLFETYYSPQIFFGTQAVLSLYATGRTDGLVFESGDGVTQVVPIYGGNKIVHASEKINLAGSEVSMNLKSQLQKLGIVVSHCNPHILFDSMKQELVEVSPKPIDPKKPEEEHLEPASFELPDGTEIEVRIERFLAGEVLFDPLSAGHEVKGVHEIIDRSLRKLDTDLRRNLYKNICLSGGNTMLNGFAERLATELSPFVNDNTPMLNAPMTDRAQMAWQGASILSGLSNFSKMWISKKELDEQGDRIFSIKSV